MDRFRFASGKPRDPIIWCVMVSWQTWSDVCDFIPKHKFVHGVFLDEEDKPMKGDNDFSNKMGVIVRGKDGQEMLFKEGETLYLKSGVLHYYNEWSATFERV
jgi:hypothetical protein